MFKRLLNGPGTFRLKSILCPFTHVSYCVPNPNMSKHILYVFGFNVATWSTHDD